MSSVARTPSINHPLYTNIEDAGNIPRDARLFHPTPSETRNDPGAWVLRSQGLTTIGARND
jgi:hypothetical protein